VATTDLVDCAGIGRWLDRFAALVERDRETLTELDTAIGDGDHGLNMARGMAAVRERLAGAATTGAPATPAAVCREAASTLISVVGGASGPLYGTFLLRLGAALPPDVEVDPGVFAAGLRAGVEGVKARGHAEPGDKTMLDAMVPAVEALEAALGEAGGLAGPATRDDPGEWWTAGLRRAADAAAAGSDATVPLVARRGRASYLGPRSAGHRDPGAASTVLLFRALADALAHDGSGPS